jgi:flagellar biosynthesis protein FlhF
MRLKTFYANSMAQALARVKTELGADALILSSREIPRTGAAAGNGPAVGYEVVAAIDSADDAAGSPAGSGTFPAPLAYDPKSLRRQHEPVHPSPPPALPEVPAPRRPLLSGPPTRAGRGPTVRPLPVQFSSDVAYELYRDLVAGDMNEWLAYKLLTDATNALPKLKSPSRSSLLSSVGEVARELVPEFPRPEELPAKRVIAFVGPTGVGKTTTIAKLAARLALEMRKKVVVLSLDSYRIGATEQLRTYAGLMGIPFRVVPSVAQLPAAVEEESRRDHVLIDTTGHSPRDLEPIRDLLLYLKSSDSIERHLVLSATTKGVDLQEAVYAFGLCDPDRLLFTKLDETSSFGPILNELVRTQRPMSYFTDGQRVPEDLHSLSRERLIDMVLNGN